jgi:uncharacterized protein (TIGR02996 family)
MNPEEKGFLVAIKKSPTDKASRSAYADWLDEHGRQYEAAIQRAKAGLSTVGYKIRRKSDGFFNNGKGRWSETGGKSWTRVADALLHLRSSSRQYKAPLSYYGSVLDDVEIVFMEVRVSLEIGMPVKEEIDSETNRRFIKISEPIGE